MSTTDRSEELTMDPEFARRICQCMAEDAIRSGRVDPKGKSDEQLKLALLECLRDEYLGQLGGLVLDHTSTLLKRARRLREEGEFYFACLLYATWAEHWLNGLVSTAGQRRKLHTDEIAQIIRDTPLRGKLTWLLSLLELPRIADRHRNAVIRLMDLRNGFVHYKWQGKDDAMMDREDEDFDRAVTGFEATVKYLQGYMVRKIFSGSLGRVRKVI
jgi:hypothetical protein